MNDGTIEHNKIANQWVETANKLNTRVFAMITVAENGRIQLMSSDMYTSDQIAKTFRHIASHVEKNNFDLLITNKKP